jgi:hypothetical protein
MRTITVEAALTDRECEARLGTFVDEHDYDHVVTGESVTVLKPDGRPLLVYVHDVLPRSLCEAAFAVFKTVDYEGGGSNRGYASGILTNDDLDRTEGAPDTVLIREGSTRYVKIKQDGTVSNTTRAADSPTAIVGYFDRAARFPYCRQTAFTMENPERWAEAVPFIRAVSEVFRNYAPEQYEAQRQFVEMCHPDFIIPGTIFSTLTLNRNWTTAIHKDSGDYSSGLGCMSVLHAGEYTGGLLCFPKYKVAADMRTGGVLLADVHEAHGNTKIIGVPGRHLRLSCVFYARTNIIECGSMEFELERAKRVGDRLATEHATEQPKLF